MGGGSKVRPGNYPEQARSYDSTRGASPTVVEAILRPLGAPAGRTVLDVGGGTGNYASALQEAGFRPVVVDASLEMLVQSRPKLGSGLQVVGDAMALPFRDGSADIVTIVNAAHLFDDVRGAFREARRVLRAGPLLVTAFTRENQGALFVFEYFGVSAERPEVSEFETALRRAGFGRIERTPYAYRDSADGSLNALHTDASRLADPDYLRNTSFWHRMDEDTRARGMEALSRDLRSGALEERVREASRAAERVGHGTLFAAWPD